MKSLKVILALLLTLSMVLPLIACGSDEEEVRYTITKEEWENQNNEPVNYTMEQEVYSRGELDLRYL